MTTTRTRKDRQVAGLTVAVWEGEGPTVVALPGLGSTGYVYGHLAGALGDRHVVAPHLRGRGPSRDLPGPTGLRAHARDVARVLTELDLSDVVVVGHSMGAFLAPLVAQEAAGRVARLVLVDGGVPPQLPWAMGPRVTRLAFGSELRRADRDWASVEAVVAKKGEPLLRDRPDLRPVLVDMLTEDFVGEPGRLRPRLAVERCVSDAVDTFFGPDVVPALEALAVPAHLVAAAHGKRDGVKAFLSDRVLDTWTARVPLLTAERAPGNHVTVLFGAEVLRAVAAGA